MSDGEWTFCNYREAFPTLLLRRGTTDEVNISLDAYGGGTHGEFVIVWSDLGGESIPQIRVYEDAWDVLAKSGVVEMLQRHANTGGAFTPAVCRDELLAMGFKDKTDSYKVESDPVAPIKSPCPMCCGQGEVPGGLDEATARFLAAALGIHAAERYRMERGL
jgi:hypothetical protein